MKTMLAMKSKSHLFRRSFAFLLLIIVGTLSHAQVDKSYILKNTDVDALAVLADEISKAQTEAKKKALEKATINGWKTENLIGLSPEGLPMYYSTSNATAAITTNTHLFRIFSGLSGQGMLLGIWDEGHPRFSHIDLQGRVTQSDAGSLNSSHGTHVSGTLIGAGDYDSDSKGMAYSASLHSYDWNGDFGEMASAAMNGLLVSNHSYGIPGGWKLENNTSCVDKYTWLGGSNQWNSSGDDPNFGRYDSYASQLDNICWMAPMYLPVFAAGNNNNKDPHDGVFCTDDVRDGTNGTYVDYDDDIHPPGNSSQFSTITSYKNAKNSLTVGNVDEDLNINPSSSRGRTDDGRIKPDICGMGTGVYSADSDSDTHFSDKTGTSMASPNVAGSLILFQERYEDLYGSGQFMRAATLKGLAIHTADDLGFYGPDFTYGWGILDAYSAYNFLNESKNPSNGSDQKLMGERTYSIGESSQSVYFNASGTTSIKSTICYTDPPGTAETGHNVQTAKLIHDLDMRIYNVESGNIYYPFRKGTDIIFYLGDNDIDNIEQVIGTPANAAPELYELRVTVEGNLTANQPYSWFISGIHRECLTDINHDNSAIPSLIYRCTNNITSSGQVNPAKHVEYNAGNTVKLTPGFHAKPGSAFIAKPEGCN